MGSLTAILLATPIFGFQLTLGPADTVATLPPAALSTNWLLVQEAEQTAGEAAAATADDSGGGDELSDEEYARQMKRRAELTRIHRPLGIATWGAMTVTLILGGIQYHNLYGFFAGQDSNPCVTGDAIFGQSQCYGTPWPHMISALVTTALYSATFTVSLMLPDPDNSDEGDSEFAKTLRMHKLLRWVHFGGMLSQLLIGTIIANNMFGLDRANDYGTLQALATVHMLTGIVTYGALTWAGALMTF